MTKEYLDRKAEQDRLRLSRGDERMRDSEDDSDCGAPGLDNDDEGDPIIDTAAATGYNTKPSPGFEESKAGFKIAGCSSVPLQPVFEKKKTEMVDNASQAEEEDEEEEDDEDGLDAALEGLEDQDEDDDELNEDDLEEICSSLKEDMVSDHLSDHANLI